MRPTRFLLAAAALAALAGCSFEEPPTPAAATPAPAVAPAEVQDPCAHYAITLLDGQLNGLPAVDEPTRERAGRVADEFQVRYDEVIAAAGVAAARTRYVEEITAACVREAG